LPRNQASSSGARSGAQGDGCAADRALRRDEVDMPKIRTRKSAAKRFRLTGNGSIKRRRANKGHLLSAKNRKRKRRLRKGTLVDGADRGRILKQLGMR
jgi:large subunit ribosomal protein L35